VVEERILALLRRYSEQAENIDATTRRLFAEDSAQGFRFVDVMRKRYDVALMNPPFGEGIPAAKATIEQLYPYSKNDLLAAFVDRGVGLVHHRGRLGAITSRACFFLTSFKEWRQRVLLEQANMAVMADLGQGVMDAAMVEAAAYCLEVRC
jgi:23S rRNA G2445 N2-methylase RlmL